MLTLALHTKPAPASFTDYLKTIVHFILEHIYIANGSVKMFG